MADKKPEGFYIYGETEQWVKLLPDNIAGKLYKRILAFFNSGTDPDFDPRSAEYMLFNVQKTKMLGYQAHVDEIREKQSKAYWKNREKKDSQVQSTIVDYTSYPIPSSPIPSNPETIHKSIVSRIGLYSTSDFEAAPEEVRRLGPDYYPTREEGSQLPKEVRAWYLAHRPSSDKLGGN